MVRENENPPVEKSGGSGLDPNKSVSLERELKEAGKWQGETADPEGTMTSTPIDIRGDATPEKKG